MTSHPTAAPPPPPPPPPLPWAFAPYYNQPLPQDLQFHPTSGFGNMVDAMEQLHANHNPGAAFRVNGTVASYKDGKVKDSWVNASGLSEREMEDMKRGAPVSAAKKGFPASGSVGVVVSSLTNAAQQSATGSTDWHAVAMARLGSQVWVHDPAYQAEEHQGTIRRMDGVQGTGNVRNLVLQWKPVDKVFFQGPPSSYIHGGSELECMGRSVQWVRAVVDGTLPWPPNRDATGGQWMEHYRN